MYDALMRPRQGIAATAAITDSAKRPAIYAEQPIASKRARRQRIAVDVERSGNSPRPSCPPRRVMLSWSRWSASTVMAGRWSSSAPTTPNSSANA